MRNAAACESGSGLCSAPHCSAARGHTGAGQRTLVISSSPAGERDSDQICRCDGPATRTPAQPAQPSPAQPSPAQHHTCPFFKQVLAGARVEPRPPAPGRARWAVRAVWRAPLSPALTASPHTLTPRLASVCSPRLTSCDHVRLM